MYIVTSMLSLILFYSSKSFSKCCPKCLFWIQRTKHIQIETKPGPVYVLKKLFKMLKKQTWKASPLPLSSFRYGFMLLFMSLHLLFKLLRLTTLLVALFHPARLNFIYFKYETEFDSKSMCNCPASDHLLWIKQLSYLVLFITLLMNILVVERNKIILSLLLWHLYFFCWWIIL